MEKNLQPAENEQLTKDGMPLRSLFVAFALDHFIEWCREMKTTPFLEIFVHFLIENELISPKKNRHYTVPRHIKSLSVRDKELSRGAIVSLVAEQFDLGESTIWSIWKEYKDENIKEGKDRVG